MKIWQSEFDIHWLNQHAKTTMSYFLGIEFVDFGEDYLVAKMPVNEKTKQPGGIMHGGASCTLAETVGSTAANLCVDQNSYAVGLDINTNHIRSISSGYVTAVSKPFHLGRSTQVWHIEIRNEKEQLISVNRLTMAVLKK